MTMNLENSSEIIPTFYGRRHVEVDVTSSLQIDLLPKSNFLEQLQREERRADRSKVPLSIALFYFDNKKRGEFSD